MAEFGYIDPARAAFEAFKGMSRDTPIEMLNLLRFRDQAIYPPDHGCAALGLSGAEAYARYGKESGPIFREVGGSVVWSASPDLVVIGPEDEKWDALFVARYPSAGAFMAMETDLRYREAVKHRQAAVLTSRLIRATPSVENGYRDTFA